MKKLIEYFKGSITEIKKVVWPNKKQTITYTIIVIGMSIGVAAFLGILDYFFNIGLGILLKIK
ncbi:MAG TPA: preprotein translocase subunit SecE [Candidatus Magasanikbacteria bacterium]|jgi:preprotein translocase subunit SecE|nr:preprotein translocase subunit SecE [Candidatus Magasanikbacteria bacterium]HQF57263.1 preprotein translocase subunit SecE [Candidatus Magasanikbacteria bacterium]HQL52609.1 preprotein translocase subunit SecE [Candidatus Magasanikbacteria bacterium]